MLLGSVLISNVYAKGSGSEKSKYNLEESCKDDVKGKLITLTGSRSVTDTTNTVDNDAKEDKDASEGGNITGDVGIINPEARFTLDPVGGIVIGETASGTIGTDLGDDHFEMPDTFVTKNPDGSVNILPLDQRDEINQKQTEEFKKSLPLKERRVFNVCNLPIGNVVDGFNYNEIEGTKKSDILLGTSAADDISGKKGGDVIQARDDDDIVHGGGGDDSVQAGFGNDNIHADDGDDAVFAGPNDDYQNGGKGNDELYAQDGDDVLEGAEGADFFDCGMGFDTVVDFSPSEGDITNDNCEDVRTKL